jgi:hypothetical protein
MDKKYIEDDCATADAWKDRVAGMHCGTCIWFVEKEPAVAMRHGAPIVGRCRRHAPTVSGYPVVYMSDWCGDHRLDENKV